MRALDPEGTNVIWVSIESLLPTRENTRPLGCHRQRKSDRGCFDGMLVDWLQDVHGRMPNGFVAI
jgi:hypothetical protein